MVQLYNHPLPLASISSPSLTTATAPAPTGGGAEQASNLLDLLFAPEQPNSSSSGGATTNGTSAIEPAPQQDPLASLFNLQPTSMPAGGDGGGGGGTFPTHPVPFNMFALHLRRCFLCIRLTLVVSCAAA